ncbi:MAG: biotin/lipoyl-containing protein, partial [Gammaproteobacteria bacterium]
MSVEIRVPALPESVADAVIAGWHKQAGDAVTQDETLVDLETDKVVLEVPAISNGIIKQIYFNVGDTVTADQVLAVIDETASVETTTRTDVRSETRSAQALTTTDAGEKVVELKTELSDRIPISPSARKLMAENHIDSSSVHG